MTNSKIADLIIESCLKVAKKRESILIIVKDGDQSNQRYSGLSILDGKTLDHLCSIGGSIQLNEEGKVLAYGQLDLTEKNGTTFLVSREQEKVLVFKDGNKIMEIDPKNPEVKKSKTLIVRLLESLGAGTVGSVSAGFLVPTLGLTFLPGVVLFGSLYMIGKKLLEKNEK